MSVMAPGSGPSQLGRRLLAGVVGSVLAIAALWCSRFVYAFVARPGAEGVTSHTCSGRYHCPSDTESAIVGLGFGLTALLVTALMGFAAFGLLRHALGARAPSRRVWAAAAAGPTLAVAGVFAVLVYGGWVGAFD
jgi:hypothetical protein